VNGIIMASAVTSSLELEQSYPNEFAGSLNPLSNARGGRRRRNVCLESKHAFYHLINLFPLPSQKWAKIRLLHRKDTFERSNV
jgi:hypothetical protein